MEDAVTKYISHIENRFGKACEIKYDCNYIRNEGKEIIFDVVDDFAMEYIVIANELIYNRYADECYIYNVNQCLEAKVFRFIHEGQETYCDID